jgi:hypothetical protein
MDYLTARTGPSLAGKPSRPIGVSNMMPYGSYQQYQAERLKSAAEIRRADTQRCS